MRVLIAEDEYWVRKSIISMLKKEDIPDIDIQEAENGEEAINLMKENPADIILTDIEMPFVDGLHLIQWVKENCPNSVTGVISGYSDFPLVKEALLNGALDYILKPVKKESLKACVDKMAAAVKEKQADAARMEHQLKAEAMYQSYLQDIEFSRYITARQRHNSISMESCGIKIPYRMILICYKDPSEAGKKGMDAILEEKESVKKRLKNIFNTRAVFWNTYRSQEYLVFTNDTLANCKEKTSLVFADQDGFLCAAVGEKQRDFQDIPAEYRNLLLKIVKNIRYQSRNELFDYTQPNPKEYSHLIRLEQYLLPLKKELENRNLEQAHKIVMEYIGLGKIYEEKWYLFEIKQVLQRIKSAILKVFQRDVSDEDMTEGDSLFDSMEQALDKENTREFTELVTQVLKTYIQGEQETEDQEPEDLIQKVKHYIDENYTDNISLSNIAEKFFVTPSYLSRSFKKAEGVNLISYITEKRIQKAKEYIENGELKLSEIAFLVGYDDYTYFNKVFKRYTKYSPKDYQTHCRKTD